jgi:hypothetical protein
LQRFVDQRLAASIQHLTGCCQHRFAPLDLEGLRAQQLFELLDGIGERRLTLVKAGRGLRVAASFHDADQRAPLAQ